MTVQVIADIATAIKESAAAGVAHRDVTPNNFGHIDGRGLLYDYSAGKVSAGPFSVVCWHQPQNLWPFWHQPASRQHQTGCCRALMCPFITSAGPHGNSCRFAVEGDLMVSCLRCTGNDKS